MFFQQTPALVEMIGLKIGWHRLQAAHALPLEATMHCSICARRPRRRMPWSIPWEKSRSIQAIHGMGSHGIFIKTPRLKGEASFTCFLTNPFLVKVFFITRSVRFWGTGPPTCQGCHTFWCRSLSQPLSRTQPTHLPCPPHHLGEPRHALWERSTVVRCLQIASE